MPPMDDPVDPTLPTNSETPDPPEPAVAVPMARPLADPEPEIPQIAPIEHDMLIPTSSRGRAIGDVVCFVVLFLAVQVAAAFLIRSIFGSSSAELSEDASNVTTAGNREMLPQMLAVAAVFSVITIGVILRSRRQSFRSIGLHPDKFWLNGIIGIGAVIAVSIMLSQTLTALEKLVPQLVGQMEENTERIKAMIPNVGPAGFVAVSLLVGFYEEVIFRGFIMTRLRRATGSWGAGVLSSTVIFVGLHAMDQTNSALIAITILSLALSLLTIWRRSIVPAVVAHTLFNLSQFLYLYYTAGDTWT